MVMVMLVPVGDFIQIWLLKLLGGQLSITAVIHLGLLYHAAPLILVPFPPVEVEGMYLVMQVPTVMLCFLFSLRERIIFTYTAFLLE